MLNKEGECKAAMRPILDSMFVLQGKWKLPILLALTFGEKGFKELEREVKGITPRMLSKELKHLEENRMVSRSVLASKPVKVNYSLTPHGKSIKPVILELKRWGEKHREIILSREEPAASK